MVMWKHIIVVLTNGLEMNYHRARPSCTHRMQSAQGPYRAHVPTPQLSQEVKASMWRGPRPSISSGHG